ncbi:DMT family transporter [Ascidiimonas aurantiaca]|uniref:DMT family transporter n=1 Tax=Ascidiimonas aurantiaca TaxID=1685432 RepID=UPI0030EE5EE4
MGSQSAKWGYLIALSIIWGSSFILIKKALIGLTPYQMGALRIAFTAFFLLVVGSGTLKNIKGKGWGWIAISGFLGSFFPAFLFAFAQTEIDSAVASMLNSLTPLNTVIIGIIFFGVMITKRQMIGVFIGLLGTLMLIVKGGDFNPGQNYWYSILVIGSSVCYAFNINIIKKHLTKYSPLTIATGNLVTIVLPALVILYATGFFSDVWKAPSMQKSLVYVAVLALFGTAMAKVVFNKLISISSPVFAASVTYTMPLMAIFWGIWDGEILSAFQLLGGAVILLGVYLVHRKV